MGEKQKFFEKRNGTSLEKRILKALLEEYEHQYGVECTYREISEDKKRA